MYDGILNTIENSTKDLDMLNIITFKVQSIESQKDYIINKQLLNLGRAITSSEVRRDINDDREDYEEYQDDDEIIKNYLTDNPSLGDWGDIEYEDDDDELKKNIIKSLLKVINESKHNIEVVINNNETIH